MFGPHFEHFSDEVRALAAATPEARVTSAAELGQRLSEWLDDEEHRQRVAAAQGSRLPDGEEVARRYLAALAPWLREKGVTGLA
jgi:3-deoxy-D-manno-octulosonic-acid transferase